MSLKLTVLLLLFNYCCVGAVVVILQKWANMLSGPKGKVL